MADVNSITIKSVIDESGVSFGTSGMRGLVCAMTNRVCWFYVTAFLQEIVPSTKRIALGHDLRPSSLAIVDYCAAAIQAKGIDIIFAGALPTPALANYAFDETIPAIMVTGSHIPFDRNGIKFYTATGELSKQQEQMITNSIVADNYIADYVLPNLEMSIAPIFNYKERYLQFFPTHFLSGMRIGVYEHSSVARDFLSEILTCLGAQVISLGRTDEFTPIDTEAVSEHDQALGANWATLYQLDAIVSTDGDADRPLIANEKGRWLRGDVVGLLCAIYLGADVVVTPLSSSTAIERCNLFKKVIRTKIGSPYVIEAMEGILDTNLYSGIVGFEANGGVLLGDTIEKHSRSLNPLLTRDATLPILCLLALVKEKNIFLSTLETSLPCRFTASNRLPNLSTKSIEKLFSHLRSSPEVINEWFAQLCGEIVNINELDGLRLIFTSGEIIHFRASGNAPELRFYTESETAQKSDRLVTVAIQMTLMILKYF
jgi:phosphomannomutase